MNWNAETPGPFDPEIVAAYLDGELEGRDELAPLRRRVEAWLAEHPQARTQLADQRRLRKLWQNTSAQEPSSGQWRETYGRLQLRLQEASKPLDRSTGRRWALAGAVVAAAACLLVVVLFQAGDQVRFRPVANIAPLTFLDEDVGPLSVAQAHEVEILNVEGADTGTVVVGELPVKGPLELATRDEISVTHMQPCQRDNMVPRVRGQHPMIWAFLDSERDGD